MDAEFAGNSLLRMVIIDVESNTSLGGLTLDPAGMHCPARDDAFVSSCYFYLLLCWFDFFMVNFDVNLYLFNSVHVY